MEEGDRQTRTLYGRQKYEMRVRINALIKTE